MSHVITALVSFAVGVVAARLFWSKAIAWANDEEAKAKAYLASKFGTKP